MEWACYRECAENQEDCGKGEILQNVMLEKAPLLLTKILGCVHGKKWLRWVGEKIVESKKPMNHPYGTELNINEWQK